MMKRLLPLVLVLMLLFSACQKEKATAFLLDEDGYGCTDTKTGVHYTALPFAFEPAKTAALLGEYSDRDADYTRAYYEIPGLDPALYLADSELGVWCAAASLPDAKTLTPTAILICEQEAISVEIFRYEVGTDDTAVTEILSLWFSGENVDLPEGTRTLTRRLKLASTELPNIYYCFDFCLYGENAYFYDLFSERAVAVPAALATALAEG